METQERNGAPEIVIHSAVYGAGIDKSIDVTEVVAKLVADGCCSVVASNDIFKDPAFGMVKRLTVKYSVDGVAHERTVAENDTLTFALLEPDDGTHDAEPALETEEIDLSDMSYADLQDACKKANLSASGSKLDLIERLTKPTEE